MTDLPMRSARESAWTGWILLWTIPGESWIPSARVDAPWSDENRENEDYMLSSGFVSFGMQSPSGKVSLTREVSFQEFESEFIEPDGWERFQIYARRVKHLNMCPKKEQSRYGHIFSRTFDKVIKSRPSQLFPNVAVLNCDIEDNDSWHDIATTVLHSGIMDLTVGVSHYEFHAKAVLAFLRQVAYRCPKVENLYLHVKDNDISHLEGGILSLLQKLPALKVLFMTSCSLTSSVLRCLSSLQNLRQISIRQSSYLLVDYRNGRMEAVRQFRSFEMASDAFKSLRYLTLQGRLQYLVGFFTSGGALSSLTELNIDMIYENTGRELRTFLETLSVSCPELLRLSFGRREDFGFGVIAPVADRYVITFEHLVPLQLFSKLQLFDFAQTVPVSMTDDELGRLLGGCHGLRRMHLNSEPTDRSMGTHLSLGALWHLTDHAPQLRELSLFVNAKRPLADLPRSTQMRVFPALASLSFGISELTQPHEGTAIYISQFLPPSCALDIKRRLPERLDKLKAEHSYSKLKEWRKAWQPVKEILPLLIQTRLDERDRILALQAELEVSREQLRSFKADEALVNAFDQSTA